MTFTPTLSHTNEKSSIQKKFRPRQVIAIKRIAYQELLHPDNKISQRKACRLIRVPRSTFQDWEKLGERPEDLSVKEQEFFSSSEGTMCLHQILLAASMTIQYGSSGIRGMQEFIRLSKLDRWVASSTGALHGWLSKVESAIVDFGKQQQKALAHDMH